jgi:putative hydrolase of the HAD superfamily
MLELSRIQAITLDLDDTLWPIWPTIALAETRLQEWLAQRAPGTAALFTSPHERLILRQAVEAGSPHRLHDLSFMRLEMIRLGLQVSNEDQGLAGAAFEVYFAARQDVTLFDDSLAALQKLAQRWPVLALSNGNADVQRIGIGAYFCGSLSAHDAGAAKPDARIFQAAADRLQLQPEQILHVGDDASMDVLGALDFGMQTAWVNRTEQVWSLAQQPHATVDGMAELCDLLKV